MTSETTTPHSPPVGTTVKKDVTFFGFQIASTTNLLFHASYQQVLDDLNHPALLFVDGVSSVASYEFEMDKWGVDAIVSGSQKGFMLPAGLGILGVSQKAIDAMKNSKYPTCYFDVADMIEKLDGGYLPYTPPVNLLRGFRVAIDMILDLSLIHI